MNFLEAKYRQPQLALVPSVDLNGLALPSNLAPMPLVPPEILHDDVVPKAWPAEFENIPAKSRADKICQRQGGSVARFAPTDQRAILSTDCSQWAAASKHLSMQASRFKALATNPTYSFSSNWLIFIRLLSST
jgi:hypothetical protein